MIRHIVFRCLHCRGTTSVQAEWTRRDQPAEVVCSDCNAVYSLAARRDRGVSNRDYYERARRFASDNSIDLASAYSVLEEILPREKVRTLAKAAVEVETRTASTSLKTLALFATIVVALAFLGNHFRARVAPKLALSPKGPSSENVRVGSIREGAPRHSATSKPTAQAPFVPIVLQTDAAGEITKLAGPDPKSVLLALSQQPGIADRLTPVTVSPGTPPGPGLRLGVLRAVDEAEGLYSVKIWLDSTSGRWTVGDGRSRIRPEPVALAAESRSAAPDAPEAAVAPLGTPTR